MPREYLATKRGRAAADELIADPKVGPIVLLAVCDPGAFLPRARQHDGAPESVPHWSARAVLAAMTDEGWLAAEAGESRD